MENKTNKFLEEYNKLVNNLRQEGQDKMSSYAPVRDLIKAMSNDDQYKDWAIKLDKCHRVRNVLVHGISNSDLDLQECLEVLEEFNKLDLTNIISKLK